MWTGVAALSQTPPTGVSERAPFTATQTLPFWQYDTPHSGIQCWHVEYYVQRGLGILQQESHGPLSRTGPS